MLPSLVLVACTPVPDAPPVLDQVAWLAELQQHRPDVMALHQGAISDPAWQALVLRPRYRAAFLASETETFETLVAREYTPALRATDQAWARSLREAQAAFEPTADVAPAGYPTEAYAGYRVGPPLRTPTDGLVADYKAFFELSDFTRSLSAERYAGFVERLAALGFRGDSKVDLRPGQVRFQYNNVIVHAPSVELARCAEAAGIAYFGADLEHVARGVDATIERRPTNWHHFLLTGRYGELPATARDFVEYVTPIASIPVCPRG